MATDRLRAFGAWVVAGACAWEIVALATGALPPITAVCHRIRRHPAGTAFIGAALGLLAWHLIFDEGERP